MRRKERKSKRESWGEGRNIWRIWLRGIKHFIVLFFAVFCKLEICQAKIDFLKNGQRIVLGAIAWLLRSGYHFYDYLCYMTTVK